MEKKEKKVGEGVKFERIRRITGKNTMIRKMMLPIIMIRRKRRRKSSMVQSPFQCDGRLRCPR